MSPQERELLANFLEQMNQTQAGQKDPDAEAMIRGAIARQPDAPYLLVQRALALEYALQAAQAEAARLKAEQAPAGAGFLNTANTWGRSAAPGSGGSAAMPSAGAGSALADGRPLPGAPAGPAGAPAARPGWGGGGMLGTLATTAAGVVAGSFLFQGLQGLMGNHGAASQAKQNPPGTDALADAPPVTDDPLAEAEDLDDLAGSDPDFGGDSGDSGDFA